MRDNRQVNGAKRKEHERLFPLFLKLKDRPCLVVGAGAVAESKIASLIYAGAKVSVVAPEATPKVRAWDRSHEVEWKRRTFQKTDLNGMLLVVAATSSTKLHKQIFKGAQRLGVLCNVVDVPALCDFYYPAVVQRGALQIAISTSGQSPALAQRLRQDLEQQFGQEYENWLKHLGKSRKEIQSGKLGPEERKRLLNEQVSEAAFQSFQKQVKKPNRPRRRS